jgi:hypothetical protein
MSQSKFEVTCLFLGHLAHSKIFDTEQEAIEYCETATKDGKYKRKGNSEWIGKFDMYYIDTKE